MFILFSLEKSSKRCVKLLSLIFLQFKGNLVGGQDNSKCLD